MKEYGKTLMEFFTLYGSNEEVEISEDEKERKEEEQKKEDKKEEALKEEKNPQYQESQYQTSTVRKVGQTVGRVFLTMYSDAPHTLLES